MQTVLSPRMCEQGAVRPLFLDALPLATSALEILSTPDRMQALQAVRSLRNRCKYSINMYVEDGYTLLQLAAQRGRSHVLQALLECGADIDKLDAKGKVSALHLACSEGRAHCVRLLLEHGASLRHQCQKNSRLGFIGSKVYLDDLLVQPVLHCSVHTSTTACMYALLEAGAQPNVTHHGRTTLQYLLKTAAETEVPCLKRKVELLLEYGARVNVVDPETRQLPIQTYLCGVKPDREVLEVLRSAGAQLFSPQTSEAGRHQRQLPLLCGAVLAGHEALAAALIAAGADVEQGPAACPHGCSPLQCAVLKRHKSLTQLLLESGASPFTFMDCHRHGSSECDTPEAALYAPSDVACGVFKDVGLTEVLYESGAAPSAQLWQQVCQDVPLMKLAAGDRKWTPETHPHFPAKFKEAVQSLLLSLNRIRNTPPLTGEQVPQSVVWKIIGQAAFPVREWLPPGELEDE